ncbi:MAG: trehalose utilization [Planctomycetota bacterium]|nr:MAG: trehalose utilization [Planctomycetota bacterium]
MLDRFACACCVVWFSIATLGLRQSCCSAAETPIARKIVLVAGETAKIDVSGHHDYLAGCQCLEVLLQKTPYVETVRVSDGWPTDESVWDGARSVVFYTDGGGKQAFLSSPERIAKLQSMIDVGVGLVLIHQAVDLPDQHASRVQGWIGGVYMKNKSGRGHWDSQHISFPDHPISRGVTSWKINDGWLNDIQFVPEKKGITPLVWSSKEYEESREGLDGHVVAWSYNRPAGGRSFAFTGLDAHSAWERAGLRQLVTNGVLWTAGVDLPSTGAPCAIEKTDLDAMLTPRQPKPAKPAAKKPV